MDANVRTSWLIGRGKIKHRPAKGMVCAVFEAQWPLVCSVCAHAIQPGGWFSRIPEQRGDLPTGPVCRHCRPVVDIKAAGGGWSFGQ